MNEHPPSLVPTSEGTTASERYLARLCQSSFLRFWSWPNVFKDQHWGGGSTGKELCDLLVVFDPHVIIFSDKYCAFGNSGNLQLDWSRWFKRAVWKSASQLHAAERWIRQQPNRIFTDPSCKVALPVLIPPIQRLRVHRVAVAHGASAECQRLLGGSGSLIVDPGIIGHQHYDLQRGSVRPFSIGRVAPDSEFVHVFDDHTLEVLLRTLDTVADFTAYLEKKEQFIKSGRLLAAMGEEDLLALYLRRINQEGEHDFDLARSGASLVEDGHWEAFQSHPHRLAQLEANEVSYVWDDLIDKFSTHALAGTLTTGNEHALADTEQSLRFLARESRTSRRVLANHLIGLLQKGDAVERTARIVTSDTPDSPHYVFVSLRQPSHVSSDQYRQRRQELLLAYCLVAKLKCPLAQDLVGIATEPYTCGPSRTEDLLYYNARAWSAKDEAEARSLQEEIGLFVDTGTTHRRIHDTEYPAARAAILAKGRSRNLACPCGSGKKYKKCHGTRA